MKETTHWPMWPKQAVAGAAALFLVMVIVAPTANASPETTPQLSIAMDNGHASADVGDRLNYRIVVKNLGPDHVKKLQITQSLPPGLTVEKAGSNGVVKPTKVSWVVSLKASGKTTLTTSAVVSKTSKQTLRLASVVCASVGTKSPPIVCASDSDQLAAGAKAEAAATGTADGESTRWFYIGIAVAVGAVALLVAVVRRRRTRTGAAPHRA